MADILLAMSGTSPDPDPGADLGADARAQALAITHIDILAGEDDGELRQVGGKWIYVPSMVYLHRTYKLNTRFYGNRHGLPHYTHFMNNAPHDNTDAEILARLKAFHHARKVAFVVQQGKITAFVACQQCGCRSEKPCCDTCYMRGKKQCRCGRVDDFRRFHKDKCLRCYNEEEVKCPVCFMDKPRQHKCMPPEHFVTDEGSGLGRPRVNKGARYLDRHGRQIMQCKFCGKHVGVKSMRKHCRRQHSLELGIKHKRFMCKHPGCNYIGTNNRSQFRRHLTSHSNKRKYKCMYCVKSYKQSEGRSAHIRKHHAITHAAATGRTPKPLSKPTKPKPTKPKPPPKPPPQPPPKRRKMPEPWAV